MFSGGQFYIDRFLYKREWKVLSLDDQKNTYPVRCSAACLDLGRFSSKLELCEVSLNRFISPGRAVRA